MRNKINTKSIENNLTLLEIFILLKENSEYNFLVGGCVRDLLIGRIPKDFDIVTDIALNQLIDIFKDNNWSCTLSGENFLVLNISKNGQEFEIANFREDGSYSDNRRPDYVNKISIDSTKSIEDNIIEDAIRRDFTVNALYLEPFTMNIIDPTGNGLNDIQNRVLRFNGNIVDRLSEDSLRIFRFYRFITKGFNPLDETLNVIRDLYDNAHIKTTPERIRIEIEGMLNKSVLNAYKSGNLYVINEDYSIGCFVVDELNVTFRVKASTNNKKILLSAPDNIYLFYELVSKGIRPTANTLKLIREVFTDCHKSLNPSLARLIIENIVGIEKEN